MFVLCNTGRRLISFQFTFPNFDYDVQSPGETCDVVVFMYPITSYLA